MRKTFWMLAGAMVLMLAACGGNAKNNETVDPENGEKAEAVEEKADTLKGPATVEADNFTVEVPEDWYVKDQSSSRCVLQPLVEPDNADKANFGWKVEISTLSGDMFKPEKFIADDADIFKDTKKMPDLKVGDNTFLYNFYDAEHGKHSVLAAALPSEGAAKIIIGGYGVEDKDVNAILKSLKLK